MAAGRFRFRMFALVAVVLAAGTAGYLFFLRTPARDKKPATEGAPLPPSTTSTLHTDNLTGATTTLPGEEPEEPMPALGESDDYVRDLARTLSSNPLLAGWLATDGLVRRFVAAVDNVAAGETPRPHLGFLAPGGKFQTKTRGERITIDPASYARYDATADTVAALDPAGLIELYRKQKPLIDDAYRELGFVDQHFDDALARAIAALLAVPVVEGEVTLTPKVVAFAFADPKLEALSPAQKHLLRMGPRNVRLIQGQLRALAEALALPRPTDAPRSPG